MVVAVIDWGGVNRDLWSLYASASSTVGLALTSGQL